MPETPSQLIAPVTSATEEERRIAILATGLGYGGAESQLVGLARELRSRGWVVRVISMLAPTGHARALAEARIPVDSLWMRPGMPDPRGMLRLRKLLTSFRPHVLHSHMVHANLLARVTRLFCSIPVNISTAHNIDEGGHSRELGYRLTDRLADLTTNVSRAAVERYVAIKAAPPHKIRWMPNGVDTNQFQQRREDRDRIRGSMELERRFVWLAVGRLEPPKDYNTLLHAFRRVADAHWDAVLLIVGDGSRKAALESTIEQLDLRERVQLLGLRHDAPALMSAADAYVMSSAWEGLPMVLLEAAACSLPIVATAVGGNPEIVLDGATGLLVPPRDPNALSHAMRSLMEYSSDERTQMGVAGRMHVTENYGITKIVDRWESLYQELLERSAA